MCAALAAAALAAAGLAAALPLPLALGRGLTSVASGVDCAAAAGLAAALPLPLSPLGGGGGHLWVKDHAWLKRAMSEGRRLWSGHAWTRGRRRPSHMSHLWH